MLIEERRRRLLETVNAKGSLSVAEAERQLAVSRMTVHRDLDVLAAQGLVRKVHGGVVAIEARGVSLFDPRARPFDERMNQNTDAKSAIAAHIIKLIGRPNTLLIDASTTSFRLAEALPSADEMGDALIVTGGLPFFSEMSRRTERLRVALHGGEPHARTGALVGPLALASLGDMRFDFAVMSCLGLLVEPGESSVYVSNPEEVELKRGYLARARKKILAADSGKLGQSGAYRLGPLTDFDFIVTENGAFTPAELLANPKARG